MRHSLLLLICLFFLSTTLKAFTFKDSVLENYIKKVGVDGNDLAQFFA